VLRQDNLLIIGLKVDQRQYFQKDWLG